ncbi:MAG: cytochrome c biogenesis CcdA family protein [Acidimicrobiales bacterium]
MSIEVVTMPLLAVAAGLVSFSSPCCLPLVPGYLSFMSALPVADLGAPQARAVTLRAALLFVAGFTLVFTVLGVAVQQAGAALFSNQGPVVRSLGVVVVILGLSNLGLLRLPAFLKRERRMDLARLPRGPAGALPLGMAFAAGWAPCIGPILATILATAAATESVAWGALLLALYSLGLGLPFVALALGYRRATGSVAWLRRNGRRIERAGGALLVGVGLLLIGGWWGPILRPIQRRLAELGWPPV